MEYLYFRAISSQDLRSRYKKMYIKANHDQILDIKEIIAHRIELGVGDIKCLMWDCAVYDQNLHKIIDKYFQRCIFLPTDLLEK